MISLADRFKDLQEKYDLLLSKNKSLQEELNLVKKEMPLKKVHKTKDSQTSYNEDSKITLKIEFPCKECIFVGNCEDELRWHMTTVHEYPDTLCNIPYTSDSCLDCGKLFDTKGEIMTHRKESHPNLIKPCTYFIEGKCSFEDSVCWYSHKSIKSAVIQEFKCRFCGENFKRKEEFMKHRKIEHENFIPTCRENKKDSCRFTNNECWYKHEEKNDEFDMEHPYNIRIIDMMEKFTERLQMFEDQI